MTERLRRLRPASTDLRLGLAAVAGLEAEAFLTLPGDDLGAGTALLLLLGASPVAFTRKAPLGSLVAYFVAGVLMAALVTPFENLTVAVLIIPGLAFSAGFHRPQWRGVLLGIAIVAAGAMAVNLADGAGQQDDDFLLPVLMFGVAPMLAGRVARRHRDRRQALAEASRQLEREREESARLAVERWRTQVAGEVHDVVAHAVGEMVVQAQAARILVPRDRERAYEAALEIESAGRAALDELRRLLGVLRRGDEELALSPQPTLRRLGALVAHARAAGLELDVRVEGEPYELGRGADLTAYRAVQAGLAAAVESRDGGGAAVHVRYGDRGLELELPGGDPEGLRRRVELYGGEVERSEGGRLRVRLPREREAALA